MRASVFVSCNMLQFAVGCVKLYVYTLAHRRATMVAIFNLVYGQLYFWFKPPFFSGISSGIIALFAI